MRMRSLTRTHARRALAVVRRLSPLVRLNFNPNQPTVEMWKAIAD